MPASVGEYYRLVKPGVLYGNVLTGAAGFLLAAGYFGRFDWTSFVAALGGMTLVIASACTINNILDRDIDAKMERTKNRAIAAGRVEPGKALLFGVVLGTAGFIILAIFVNWLVTIIGAAGFAVYVWLYGAFSKRRSMHGTLVGSISGAMPILAGYCAVSDKIDAAAVILFLALFLWQFPEFYSIAIYRRREYKAAKIPVVSLVKGVPETKRYIMLYTIAFVADVLLLTILGYTGWVYFGAMAAAGIYWLRLGLTGRASTSSDRWARRMFHASLLVLLVFCLMLSVGALLP